MAYLLVTGPASKLAETGIADIRELMKARGYRSKTVRQSATYEITFKKGDRVITMIGWHSCNGYRSTGKSIFSLTDNKAGVPFDKVVEMEREDHSSMIDEQQQRAVIKKIIDHIVLKA